MKLYTTTQEKIANELVTIRTTDSIEKQEAAIENLCDIHREHMTIEFAETVEMIQYNDRGAFEIDRDRRVKARIKQLYNI